MQVQDFAGRGLRSDRLSMLAGALFQFNDRIRLESRDPATALALRERFAPALPDIRATQDLILAQVDMGRFSRTALSALHSALGGLTAALSFPLSVDGDLFLSRPAARRARLRAGRLNDSARDMLGAIGKVLAFGVAATALYATPAAAGCTINGSNATCDADVSSGVIYTYPVIDNLTVQDLTVDITPVAGAPGVAIGTNANGGSGGGAWSDGDDGDDAHGVTVTVTDPDNSIVMTDFIPGVLIGSFGGQGGSGGGAGAGGSGGDGGWGGDGGSVTANVNIDVSTSGTGGHGVVAISSGGGGGGGGDFAVGIGSAGDGGQGGAGGSVTVNLGNVSIITLNKSADGIFASSLGGFGGAAGSCDVAICGSSGGGNSATGGAVVVSTSAGSSIATNGIFSKGIRASSIGGFAGSGGSSYFSVGFASNGASAGDGGSVTVTARGQITTQLANSDGIYAQSIGGGGGDGGDTGISIASLGGSGAAGGDGGTVNVTNTASGDIETFGVYSRGILAQSIGGGGGSGGTASSLVSVGGSGSGSSDGSTVTVTNNGSIATHGKGSQGIFVQSIGGGGGDGGGAGGLVAIGGSAGSGGDGGVVSLSNGGSVSTDGADATAIYAQSIGGGGGDGGDTGGLVSIGGKGAAGGDGKAVTVSSNGAVTTLGDRSLGIFAQSVGGGGGAGGDAASVGAFVSVSVGGQGGAGGDADAVTVSTGAASDIYTRGERASAIFAQSIGGGGGVGGFGAGGSAGAFGSITVSVGGEGGVGGDGKAVTVNSAGLIETDGSDSMGVFAQSVGGGGGSGGFAVAVALAGGPVAIGGSVSVGGVGGDGGISALVDVNNQADIDTTGDRATGIYAQSVGGGGGNGGWSGAIAGAGGSTAGAIAVSVGGFAGGGGDGGLVDVDNSGDIHTRGLDGFGILAQSVGGGGGTGGFSVAVAGAGGGVSGGAGISIGGFGDFGGDGKAVTLTNSGDILTDGDRGTAIFAQSLGGGGGAGGWSGAVGVGAGGTSGGIAIGVGGFGAGGGDGDTVDVANTGNLHTRGVDAYGVLGQSVGGGGGTGGFSLGVGVGAGATAVGGAVNVGGGGGPGGAGAAVTVSNAGNVLTENDRSVGVAAQSIGGGGGNGGFTGSIAVAAGTTAAAVNIGIGGFGGIGGGADLVRLSNTGTVQTIGDDAQGVFAQSIGGGGGNGGFSAAIGVAAGTNAGAGTLNIGGFGGAAGNGGEVIVTSSGMTATLGDRSTAIQAQSIGGGGGSGGVVAAFTAAFSSGTPVALGLGLGGFGGAAGDADRVTVTASGGASTSGASAHGVFAQSVGGGGGSGGFSVGGALTAGGSQNVSINARVGGFGGAAGDGEDVSVTSGGLITTNGEGSHGVFAQSVGGGGGDGGWAGALSGAFGSTKSVNIGVTLGGFGGAAGGAGDVIVISHGQILTYQDTSYGILAQSVGGGGGTGGAAISANIGLTQSTNVAVGVGGFGGASGAAGDVDVTSNNTINTKGDGSVGIYAQSVGGGGGVGGSGGALAFSGSQSVNLTTSVGGFAANGSIGGRVDVLNKGAVWTTGEGAHGIQAQSIGGGGGHGGMAGIDENEWGQYLVGGSASVSFGSRSQNIALALGGSGGIGGDGGETHVTNNSTMRTDGATSHVIFAQSVGGGGGDAGVATAAAGAFGAGKNGTYSIAMGGFGGAAGDGGLVRVINTGQLLSTNDGSHGIFAESIGGGGGAGGDARGFALSFSPSKSKGATSVSVSLGGYGGAAGDGGEVEVINSGQIVTEGGQSFGIFAQSIGGGGGAGGSVSTQGEEIVTTLDMINKGDAKGGQIAIGGSGAAAGDGGGVIVSNGGLIYTQGDGAHGIFAQSVGGGGGVGGSGLAGEVSIGGQGAAAGDGGEVRVTNTGLIVTDGDVAKGIFAQSIGGGGGTGGATDYDGEDTYSYRSELSATMGVVGNLQDTIQLAQSFAQPAWGIGIGGMGGSAGDGGLVIVNNTGGIVTHGVLSTGIFAQSVGGGGGNGGEATWTAAGQVVFSGLGGSSGDGGDVQVTNIGSITTDGIGAIGILAQSVGGGGGLAGDYSLGIASWGDTTSFGGQDYSDLMDLQLNPVHANGGDGGDVTVTNTGTITINGIGAVGILAQSVGGGGGLFGGKLLLGFIGSMEGVGEGGKVTVIQNGNVLVTGKNGIGALFQSASKDGDDDISVTMNGAVKGGSVYGMGVLIDGGKNNSLVLNGLTWADSNLAITTTNGNDAVISNVGVIGNVDLGLGTNSFTNAVTSTFQTLDYVKLNGGPLTNAGTVTPGGLNHVQTTAVQGRYVQSATGVFLTDLDLHRTGLSGEIDRLNMTGPLDLKGAFTLNIMNPGYALPGHHVATILDGTGALVQSGLVLNKPISAVASFVLTPTAQDLNLTYDIDFSPVGLNGNQTALGDHINAIQTAGSSPTFAPIAAELFYVPTVTALANIYDSFSPEAYAVQQAGLTFAAQQFADSMMTCPRSSAGVSMSERGCVWAKPAARWLKLDATTSSMAYTEQSAGLSTGFETALGESSWRLGGALSGESVDTGVTGRTDGDGERFQAGAVLKHDAGGLSFALAVHGGQSDLKTKRMVILPSGLRFAEGDQKTGFIAATARLAYRWGDDAGYVKPIVEISRLRVETDGFTETGAGALNLVIPKQSDDFTRFSGKVEVGGEFMAGGAAVRPYVRAGASHSSDAANALFAAAFAGAPPAATHGFAVNPGLDETTIDAELGVTIAGPTASGRLAWTGQFGDRTDAQTLSFKFTLPF